MNLSASTANSKVASAFGWLHALEPCTSVSLRRSKSVPGLAYSLTVSKIRLFGMKSAETCWSLTIGMSPSESFLSKSCMATYMCVPKNRSRGSLCRLKNSATASSPFLPPPRRAPPLLGAPVLSFIRAKNSRSTVSLTPSMWNQDVTFGRGGASATSSMSASVCVSVSGSTHRPGVFRRLAYSQ